jgi:hypothetical protein
MVRSGQKCFGTGEAVVIRYITREGSLPGMSWPARVVEDGEECTALYIPAGTEFMSWGPRRHPGGPKGPLRLVKSTRDVLRLMFPGRQHAVLLFWEPPNNQRFLSYYVNMEEPFRRTPIGFDTCDHALDIVVQPDFTWAWKDEDELAAFVSSGAYSAEFASSVRAEACRLIDDIERRAFPFGSGWEAWEPDPSWDVPALPDDWREIPATTWERRDWAYGPSAPKATN